MKQEDRDEPDFSDLAITPGGTIVDKETYLRNNQGEIETKDEEIKRLKYLLESHGPEGHNVTNLQYSELRAENAKLRDAFGEAGYQLSRNLDPGKRIAKAKEIISKALAIEPEECVYSTKGMRAWYRGCNDEMIHEAPPKECPNCHKPVRIAE